jgi:hypothetical protein
MRLLVPFGRDRDQFAVAVTAGIGDHDMGQRARLQLLRRRSIAPSSASRAAWS